MLSLKAGGTGLNLTAASHVIHFDRWWNPAVENQATDRAFRIGQTKNVLVHKFVCRGTVEEKIDELIESKRQLSQDLLEGGAELLLTEMNDDELLKLVALDLHAAPQAGVTHVTTTDWKPYVPVAERRHKPRAQLARLTKKGQTLSPVVIDGRNIAKTFWGKAWCDNLERYSDYANRLPRGRTYVRNGSVIDLQIAPGAVTARVSGSDLYAVHVKVAAVPKARWSAICQDCAGAIDSLVELLQGRFSRGVMERICGEKTGLFPSPSEITFDVQLPGLGLDVQARRRRALRHRRPPRRKARAAVHAAQGESRGSHREGGHEPAPNQERSGGRKECSTRETCRRSSASRWPRSRPHAAPARAKLASRTRRTGGERRPTRAKKAAASPRKRKMR